MPVWVTILAVRDRILRDLSSGLVIIFVDIPTGENHADIATRPNEVYSKKDRKLRSKATALRGQLAFDEWKLSGKRYFHRDDIVVTLVEETDSSDEEHVES